MGDKTLFARKIDVMGLMEALEELYHMGVNYIDISGIYGEDHDTILLSFPKDYMDEASQEDFEDIKTNAESTPESTPEIKISLTDDDINQLT